MMMNSSITQSTNGLLPLHTHNKAEPGTHSKEHLAAVQKSLQTGWDFLEHMPLSAVAKVGELHSAAGLLPALSLSCYHRAGVVSKLMQA